MLEYFPQKKQKNLPNVFAKAWWLSSTIHNYLQKKRSKKRKEMKEKMIFFLNIYISTLKTPKKQKATKKLKNEKKKTYVMFVVKDY